MDYEGRSSSYARICANRHRNCIFSVNIIWLFYFLKLKKNIVHRLSIDSFIPLSKQPTADVQSVPPSRELTPADAQNSFGDRDFSVAGSRIWNDLPPELRHVDISYLDNSETCWNRISLDFSQPRRIVTFWLLRLRSSLTYLLTYLLTYCWGS